jgi:hypothetical protein
MTPETKAEAARALQEYARFKSGAHVSVLTDRRTNMLRYHPMLGKSVAREQRNSAAICRVAREILCELVTDNADRLYTAHRNIEMETVIHIAAMRAGMLDY